MDAKTVVLCRFDGAIGPAISDYIQRGIDYARLKKAELIVIEMDTPGGLDKSMRDIVKSILDSPIPVVTYVSPKGARAASAGTYILYASHIAAMAPMTNLGAATPVQIGGVPKPGKSPVENPLEKKEDSPPKNKTAMEKKIINDAAAYIRGLAQQRNRNIKWAEKAVREGVSLSSKVALEKNVIDLIANSISDLLKQIDGKKVVIKSQTVTVSTSQFQLDVFEQDWKTRLLTVITSPEVAYILLLIGIYSLFFEFSNKCRSLGVGLSCAFRT